MTREEVKEDREMERNGIFPLIYKRIICILWKGHNYIPITPEDIYGKRLFECKYCKNSMYGKEYYLLVSIKQ